VDHLCPDVASAAVTVLERIGLEVHVPDGQTCCGQPAFNGGFTEEAAAMARHTVDVLSRSDLPVVVPSGSCADMIVHRYPSLLADDPAYAARAQAVAARTYEFTQFLVDVMGRADLGVRGSGKIAYHASCHGLRGLGLRTQPMALLQHVEGAEAAMLPDADVCCGFGGLFAIRMAPISAALLSEKIANIATSGADTVVTTDVSCLVHIGGGLRRQGSAVKTRHIAEVLAGDPHA
jgi:L-lactate dehydrogenase complex protein LldE